MSQLCVRRIAYSLGAEVTGIDLRKPLDEGTVSDLRRIWLTHLLLHFPNQRLEPDEFVAFARRFGAPEDVAQQSAPSGESFINLLSNKPVDGIPWDGYKQGQEWHTDQSFTIDPTVATFILCRETPAVGGDTMFANMYMAYDTLSPTMRGILDGLWAVHDASNIKNKGARDAARLRRVYPPVAQPAARIHPETHRRALYLCRRVSQFVGMTEEESRPLLFFLNAHAVSYEFTYRHRWSVDDLVMWDNRCLLHLALSDYNLRSDIRHMLRCAVTGSSSGYLFTERESTAAATLESVGSAT